MHPSRHHRFRVLCPPRAGVAAKRPGVDAYGPPTVAGHEIVDRVDRANSDPTASAAPRLVSPAGGGGREAAGGGLLSPIPAV